MKIMKTKIKDILLFIQIENEMLNLQDYLRNNNLKEGDKIIVIDTE